MQVRAFAPLAHELLIEAAAPEKAYEMQAYMKSALPFLGVHKPPRFGLLRELKRALADPASPAANLRDNTLGDCVEPSTLPPSPFHDPDRT